MKTRWRLWLLGLILFPLFLVGCVSPATARKIDTLEGKISLIAKDHKAGLIPTAEAVDRIAELVTEVKELKNSGESIWNMVGYWILTTLGTVIGARKMGIPGIAHGTGLPFKGSIAQ